MTELQTGHLFDNFYASKIVPKARILLTYVVAKRICTYTPMTRRIYQSSLHVTRVDQSF